MSPPRPNEFGLGSNGDLAPHSQEYPNHTHGLAEGPFRPQRAGSLPTSDLIDLAFSGTLDSKQLHNRLVGEGGPFACLGTTDVRKVEEMVGDGDERAKLIQEAMAYQIAKDIGAMCVVLKGAVHGIILTGGMAHSEMLAGEIEKWASFLAPVFVFPGEDEMTPWPKETCVCFSMRRN
jgi:butyrate kinase